MIKYFCLVVEMQHFRHVNAWSLDGGYAYVNAEMRHFYHPNAWSADGSLFMTMFRIISSVQYNTRENHSIVCRSYERLTFVKCLLHV